MRSITTPCSRSRANCSCRSRWGSAYSARSKRRRFAGSVARLERGARSARRRMFRCRPRELPEPGVLHDTPRRGRHAQRCRDGPPNRSVCRPDRGRADRPHRNVDFAVQFLHARRSAREPGGHAGAGQPRRRRGDLRRLHGRHSGAL